MSKFDKNVKMSKNVKMFFVTSVEYFSSRPSQKIRKKRCVNIHHFNFEINNLAVRTPVRICLETNFFIKRVEIFSKIPLRNLDKKTSFSILNLYTNQSIDLVGLFNSKFSYKNRL